MQQSPDRWIGERCVGEQHLLGREGAGICRIDRGAGAKEGDLEAEVVTISGAQPAGHIPPLGAKLWVGAAISGKSDRRFGPHRRVSRRRRSRGGCKGGRQSSQEATNAAHYQSSRTARTADAAVALRPERTAVPAAAAIRARARLAKSGQGRRVSIVQLNDCGLIT